MGFFESDIVTWIAIAFCVSQSAMFSGMNLAMFSLSRLLLEVEVASGNKAAGSILAMRADSNALLTTILWGNVGVNVLLTLLSDSVLTGVAAFAFSTFVITIFGEIAPQAYFSRNAMRVAVLLGPVLRLYQILLYPLAKPSALILDRWLGKEGVQFLGERNLRELLRKHIDSPDAADIDRLEGLGALNFLSLDDLPMASAGELIDPDSVIFLPTGASGPVFPAFDASPDDPFLKMVAASGRKWVIIVDEQGEPRYALDSDEFLRHVLFLEPGIDPLHYCHRPIIMRSGSTPLGSALSRLRYRPGTSADGAIEHDVILMWGEAKRVITGSDILERLMRGTSRSRSSSPSPPVAA